MPAPVKGTTGCDGDRLAFTGCVVQLHPTEFEALSFGVDAVVALRRPDDNVLLGIGRVWPFRSVKPGAAKLGWGLYAPQSPEYDTGKTIVRIEVIALPIDDLRSRYEAASAVELRPAQAGLLLDAFAHLSIQEAAAKPDISLETVISCAIRRALRGSLCAVGACVCIRVRGESRSFIVTACTGTSGRMLHDAASTLLPFSVESDTSIVVTSARDATAAASLTSTESHMPEPAVDVAVSEPSAIAVGGMKKLLETMRTMLRLPLFQSELFVRMGLQPYR